MYNYGITLCNGENGLPANPREGYQYLQKAADGGVVYAMYDIAIAYRNGSGVPVNMKEAVRYYKMAADNGSVEAMNDYATILRYGQCGVQKDERETARYFKMAENANC